MPLTKMNAASIMTPVKKDLIVSSLVPLTHLNSPEVFETSNGMIGSVIRVEGVPFDTETTQFIKRNHAAWQSAIKSLTDSVALHVTIHRHRVKSALRGAFKASFCEGLDRRYHAQFEGKGMYQHALYLTLQYKGITTGKTGKVLGFYQALSEKTVKSARSARRAEQTKALMQVIALVMSQLAPFKPVLLGSRDDELGYSELTAFLGLIINGGESLTHPMPGYASVMGKNLTDTLKGGIAYPDGKLSQYLSRKRIYFGTAIQFQGASKADTRFAAMLSIKSYSEESHALMLDNLLDLDSEFIATHTFAPLSRDEALKQAKNRGIQLRSVEDAAVSQIHALTLLRDQVASGDVVLGFHHHTLMLLSNSVDALEKSVNKASACYGVSGIVAVREDVGQQAAFWAQLPGNFRMIARSAMVTHKNFADLCPLHNYPSGFRDGNHLGSAVTLLATPSNTPYFFNYHLPSPGRDKQNITNGHTVIIGSTGAGKTALMAFLDAQTSRYGGKTFVFDRKRGLDTYIRAAGGYYTALSPNEQQVQFNPLQLEDNPENRMFCSKWLEQLIKDEHAPTLDQDTIEVVKACIDYAFDTLMPEHRTLSHVAKRLPTNFPRWPSLRRWLRAEGKFAQGHYAYLFDNPVDTFAMHPKMGFDMTYLLDNEPPMVRAAVMMYVMHRIKLSLDGTLLSIYMDEGWQYLDDPYWQNQLETFFGSFRSKNAHIIFATQSAKSVVNSPLNGVIMSNVATKILFGNGDAEAKDYMDGFNLTEEEFLAIKSAPHDKRLFLVKQKSNSCLCSLPLQAIADLLPVLSSNEDTLRKLDILRERVGDAPSAWLPLLLDKEDI